MAPSSPPKALLFDIGGVCVASPFQAILDYELANSIPPGWINFSISRSAPDGTWQQLERGQIPLDASFFSGFKADLQKEHLWREFHAKAQLRARQRSPPATTQSSQQQQQQEPEPLATLSAAGVDTLTTTVPPVPAIDAEYLFWEMMRVSRAPDPHMYPFLQHLARRPRSSRPLLAALSNTVIFPPAHPYSQPAGDDVRTLFDVFVSSAHVGLRKPDPRIYALALRRMDEWDRSNGGRGVQAGDVLFLDDIGQNLRAGRAAGMGTLKVELGRGDRAVEELRRVLGVDEERGGSREVKL